MRELTAALFGAIWANVNHRPTLFSFEISITSGASTPSLFLIASSSNLIHHATLIMRCETHPMKGVQRGINRARSESFLGMKGGCFTTDVCPRLQGQWAITRMKRLDFILAPVRLDRELPACDEPDFFNCDTRNRLRHRTAWWLDSRRAYRFCKRSMERA